MKEKFKNKGIFYLCIFIILMIFYNIAHPLIIYNTDDWYNIGYMRRALPIWGYFNPIKVFPETLMPFAGYIGAYIIYPILGDYIRSLAIACGLILCLFILLYVVAFDQFIIKKFHLSNYVSSFVTAIFVIFHFLFFKTNTHNNEYLLSSIDITCFFNYTIPALLNGALVLYLLGNDINKEFNNKNSVYKTGVLCLAFYLALCSNLFENAILAVWVGIDLLISLIGKGLKKFKVKKWVFENKVSILLLVGWCLTLVFELSGQRAQDLSGGKAMNLGGAIQSFMKLVLQTNKLFVLISGMIVLVFLWLLVKNKEIEIMKEWIKIVAACILMCVYILLLSAKVSAGYAGRSDVFLSIGFYVLLCVCFSLAYIMKKIPQISIFIPMIVFVLFMQVINGSKAFKDANGYQLSWEQCKEVDDYILSEIIEADKNGKESMKLSVPKGSEDTSNWPHATYMGSLISDTLYRHGVIRNPIDIEIIPDERINEKYNLN